MCVASPADGREVLQGLTEDHFSGSLAKRAWRWLSDHLEAPTEGLARDDELWTYVNRVVMQSEHEPVLEGAIEISRLQLELALVEDQLSSAEGNGGEPPVELQRRRAELTEQIARAHA
jgi:hypothetical protein